MLKVQLAVVFLYKRSEDGHLNGYCDSDYAGYHDTQILSLSICLSSVRDQFLGVANDNQ